MNTQRKTEIKVGIVSLVAILLLIAGISLGKGVNVSVSQNIVKMRFNSSGGIQDGAPVVVNGVKRGTVRTIENNNGSVLITADMDMTNDFKSDASALITILEITGGKKIEINPGKSADRFNNKNEIPGRAAADIGDLVTILGDISGSAVSLVLRLDTLTGELTRATADGMLVRDLKSTMKNTAELTHNLNSFMNDNASGLKQTLADLRVMTSDLKHFVDNNDEKLASIVTKLDNSLNDVEKLIKKADSAIEGADKLITNVNGIALDVKNGNGLASKLIYDQEFAAKLDSTLKSLNGFVDQIQAYGVNVNLRLGTRP